MKHLDMVASVADQLGSHKGIIVRRGYSLAIDGGWGSYESSPEGISDAGGSDMTKRGDIKKQKAIREPAREKSGDGIVWMEWIDRGRGQMIMRSRKRCGEIK